MNNMNNIDKVYCKKDFEYYIFGVIGKYVKGRIYNSTSSGNCIFIYMNIHEPDEPAVNNFNGMWFGDYNDDSYKFRNFHEYFIDFKSYERTEKLRVLKTVEDE
jgi:hypothetical protein